MVDVAKINGCDEKRDKSMAMVHFAMRTGMEKYLSFPLRKTVGPSRIDGCMKGRSRSMVKNVSRSRTARGVHKRKFGGRMNGTWMVNIKDSFDETTEKTPEVHISHPVWR